MMTRHTARKLLVKLTAEFDELLGYDIISDSLTETQRDHMKYLFEITGLLDEYVN